MNYEEIGRIKAVANNRTNSFDVTCPKCNKQFNLKSDYVDHKDDNESLYCIIFCPNCDYEEDIEKK